MTNCDKTIHLTLGDLGISISWERSKVTNWPFWLYKEFAYPPEKIDIALQVICGFLPKFSKEELIFDAQNHWKLYRSGDGYVVEECDVKTHKIDRVIFLDSNFSKGVVHITPDVQEKGKWSASQSNKNGSQLKWSIHRVIDPLLKILTARWLVKNNGVLIHGLSICDRNEGILFVGKSGTGKSTLAGFFQGVEGTAIMNDEKTILIQKDGKYFLQGTPWPGDSLTCAPLSVPLKRIFFLKHHSENRVSSLSLSKSFSYFFPQLFLPFWDKKAVEQGIKFSEKVLVESSGSEYGFIRDKSAVDFIRREYTQ